MSFSFHHSESAASLASSAEGDGEPVTDSGIKLPPDAELFPAEVLLLRPTQMAVGMQQVHVKMAKARKKLAKGPAAFDAWLQAHPIPVVLGPAQALYLIDHHHLYECGVKTCYAGAARDLSSLSEDAFWAEMAAAGCLWPHTADGSRLEPSQMAAALPNTVAELRDDPYRSLAALVRKAGGFVKSTRPFSEFMWGNYLRDRVPLALEAPGDVVHFVGRAISHATAGAASHLPGHTPVSAATGEQLDAMADLGAAVAGGDGADSDGEKKKGKAGGKKKGAAAGDCAAGGGAAAGVAAGTAAGGQSSADGACAAEAAPAVASG
ncbi:hypothetical protein Rsub_10628 [Raphidocelis subcapitata]|uniref:Chromosome partitioning protein ParB n=1 Tax=Raphidocelis subcapitata TaxID=307507 RepID=A0A2V0PLP7_9CHLO|nr:hypothetical protein Rsub_10628 [Raphidocelis subcapitata]|eukprot:GBF97955.1 hypothetical protein Rsub_10628 [Raphidocelis subcapitata]